MKRLNDEEKRQLGILIHHYRNQYFHSENLNAEGYKQINFCKDICSQAQLSRLEHGDILKDQGIYELLAAKLKIDVEKVPLKDYYNFESYFENIMSFQNDERLVLNNNEYVMMINKYQNLFKHNIIYIHYNYALEFILAVIDDNLEDAEYLAEDVENTIEILPPKFLILTLQYLGIYYHLKDDFAGANKFYLLAIEHMHNNNIENPIIYIEAAYNSIDLNKSLYALDYLNKAYAVLESTENNGIIERIFRGYALVNLKNGYYDEGLNFCMKSMLYANRTKKNRVIANSYCLVSAGLYLINDYVRADKYANFALKAADEDKGKLISFLISLKTGIKKSYPFKDERAVLIRDLYCSEDKEKFFDDHIEDKLNLFSDEISLILLHDMYQYYKENKKYKKALDIRENYL